MVEEISLTPLKAQHSVSKEFKVGSGVFSTTGSGAWDEVAMVNVKGLSKVNIIVHDRINSAGNVRVYSINQDVGNLSGSAPVKDNYDNAPEVASTAVAANTGVVLDITKSHTWLVIDVSKTSAGAGASHYGISIVGET